MPMQDKLQQAEQQLKTLQQVVAADDYEMALSQLTLLQQRLEQLFSGAEAIAPSDFERLQLLADDFFTLVSVLSVQREQIKDSINQIAAVKSANKISKTYKID
jgi:hypothetical protein